MESAGSFLQFWFPFVRPGLSYLESGHGELVLDRLKKKGVESVAVCFLFSFLNPENERSWSSVIQETWPRGLLLYLIHHSP